ncbi:type II toxin-antitoxin system HipA family toxin [Pseudomonas sp. GW456-12-10-14-LB2]|jgi:serine/threonine-protein kinase HipA|uniref:type II toxin-antitoxin system HipA family toxin n=1 Tax=Pseudomonas sp. GW456-12-10-14-LB2 TaxID=2070674 RepID=UPI000C9AFE17|nr:type II toxin-antitoxin system HipA family toxin [Pseudomonas sp. GW456-12-10-14-LB2]PNB51955.1 type II toxin-antitoxin system HipA family toxin [Pseudomonas sp. GW456-12-10-14-LB2]
MSKVKRLNVTTPQGFAGELSKGSQFSFVYETADATREVSLVMPYDPTPSVSNVLHPIFDMNVPEGFLADQIKRRMAKHMQVDEMRLLSVIGGNQIGRLTYQNPIETPVSVRAQVGLQEILSADVSQGVFDFLVDTYFESGISGVQPKVLVPDLDKLTGNRKTMLSSDLIVKSGADEYAHLAQNEFLCLEAARLAGLETPPFWLSENGDLFVMERFDLTEAGRLGFEDMAVLLGLNKDPHDNYKYSQSYETLAAVIGQVCRHGDSLRELELFFASVCLSVMVRNGDAHLKNFGVIYTHPEALETVQLAPVFDVTTTTVYENYNPKSGRSLVDRTLAIKMNKVKTYPDRQQLIEFGRKHCSVEKPALIIERIAEAMTQALANHQARVNGELFADMQREWDAGRVVALNDSVGSGMKRKPVGTTRI